MTWFSRDVYLKSCSTVIGQLQTIKEWPQLSNFLKWTYVFVKGQKKKKKEKKPERDGHQNITRLMWSNKITSNFSFHLYTFLVCPRFSTKHMCLLFHQAEMLFCQFWKAGCKVLLAVLSLECNNVLKKLLGRNTKKCL